MTVNKNGGNRAKKQGRNADLRDTHNNITHNRPR